MRHLEIGTPAQTIDSLDDTAAVLTIAGGGGNALEVLSATSTACTTLGHTSTSQLVGMNACQILPEPVRDVWRARMEGIVQRGFGPFLGFAEVGLVQGGNGAVQPCVLSLQEATPDEDTSRPRLQLAFDPLASQDNIIVFMGSRQKHRILCASQRSLSMLGMEAQTLEKEPTAVSRWMPSALVGGSELARAGPTLKESLALHCARAVLGLFESTSSSNSSFGDQQGDGSFLFEGPSRQSGSATAPSRADGASSATADALKQALDAVVPVKPDHEAKTIASHAHGSQTELVDGIAHEIRRLLLIALVDGAG